MSKSGIDPRAAIGEPVPAAERPPYSRRLREISRFFDGTDRVHRAMRRVAGLFDQHAIPYAIIGGMAVNAHRHARTTQDVDFLVRASAMPETGRLVAGGALTGDPGGRTRRFFEPSSGVRFDVPTAGSFPGSGRPGPHRVPGPARRQ